jgi:putative protein kinase ArgK-like GTPase of G3E family
VMEIADVFVINKADLPGADHLHQDLRGLLEVAPARKRGRNAGSPRSFGRSQPKERAWTSCWMQSPAM